MRQKLQYAYSITVFIGVLITTYTMTNRNESILARSEAVPNSPFRTEAAAVQNPVAQLLEMEDAIVRLRKADPKAKRRVPSVTSEIVEKGR